MRILSFSRVIPFVGIPHAGGEFVGAYYAALRSAGHDVRVVVPADPRNVDALQHTDDPWRYCLIEANTGPIEAAADRIWNAWKSIYPPRRYVRALLASEEVQRLLQWADVVDYQWTETAALSKFLKPGGVEVGVAHDVLTQKYRREWEERRSAKTWMKHQLVRWREPELYRRLDHWCALSQKDVDLIKSAGAARTHVLHPSLEVAGMDSPAVRATPPTILFVGALSRLENEDGISWFLDEVWANISHRTNASLVIAGARPSEKLRQRAEAAPRVQITGYVEDLGPLYRDAAVVVVPLRLGAGVKFKTLTAMLWGKPVVTTTVGAEGIDPEGLFVADSAESFAKTLTLVLSELDSPEVADRVRRSRQSARAVASNDAMRASVLALIQNLFPTGMIPDKPVDKFRPEGDRCKTEI